MKIFKNIYVERRSGKPFFGAFMFRSKKAMDKQRKEGSQDKSFYVGFAEIHITSKDPDIQDVLERFIAEKLEIKKD